MNFQVYAERIQPLPTPPLPLSTEIDHSSFALDCNVDFRHEQVGTGQMPSYLFLLLSVEHFEEHEQNMQPKQQTK